MQRGSRKNRILDFWVGIPLLNLLATVRRRRQAMPRDVRRVGVMCSPALGDTLLFSAVLQDLRAYFGPSVEMVHVCMKANLAAAEIIPGADRRLLIDLTNPRATVGALRAERFDALLDFSAWQRLTAFYTMTAGARFTAGFRTAGQRRGRGYDVTVEHSRELHELENFRAILTRLLIPSGAAPAITLPEAAPPLSGEKDIVVFHLWASGQQSLLREWPEPRWVELAQRLARPGTLFAITGAPSDLPRSEPFVARLAAAGLRAAAFTGTDGFRTLARMLKRARVVVSVNTGVMHLAAIVGAPTVSLNGPTRDARWGPAGPRALGVNAPGADCGYLHLGFDFGKNPPDCMERITVDAVVEGVRKVGGV